jgi:pyruvate dehydrogenase E2 component (dihydrolipoamide acetyltransferase)
VPHVLLMPEVAANTTEAVVSSWVVALNQPYKAGDPIVTIETDKAVVDVEAESDGVLVTIIAQPGARVEVGAPIAWWSEDGTGAGPTDTAPPDQATTGQGDGTLQRTTSGADDRGTTSATTGLEATNARQPRLFASPLARKLVRQNNLELSQIKGSGPRGRIRRIDVDAAVAAMSPRQAPGDIAGASDAAASSTYTDVPVSRMRSAIARRLTQSKRDAPHFYLRGSARVDRLLDLRKEVNALPGARRTSVTDWLVKAIGTAHTLEPSLNVEWRGDAIREFVEADVAVAVATEDGLLTPVVRSVQSKNLGALSVELADVADRSRSRKLRQPELDGGSITLTNLGMYGVEDFAAIINPPQAAILAVGAARRDVVATDDGVGVATVLKFTLAVDHRAVDGAQAAQWLQHFQQLLEEPLALLLPLQRRTST